MLNNFNYHKANYREGQIAPFLIAILCVLIILIMITANLGQLAIYKTDTSNAADAAGLAATSTLAGTLLGIGLKSDMMAGRGFESYIVISLYVLLGIITFGATWVLALILYLCFLVEQWGNLMFAYGDARMAWTRAKRGAVQYAFNNASVDEPRPTFEEFLKGAYSMTGYEIDALPAATISTYYNEYITGNTPNARWHGQSGFSRFMMDQENGFWNEDDMGHEAPGEFSKAKVVSGYGWNDAIDETAWRRKNSYQDGGGHAAYDNWVEVTVLGDIMYGIEYFSFLSALIVLPFCIIDAFNEKIDEALDEAGFFGDVLQVIFGAADLVNWLVMTFLSFIFEGQDEHAPEVFPTGLRFFCEDCSTTLETPCCNDEDIQQQLEDNWVNVKVKRYRKDTDLGLWTMHYGEVESEATSHLFRESLHQCEDIRPGVFLPRCCWQAYMDDPTQPCDDPDEPGDQACAFIRDIFDEAWEQDPWQAVSIVLTMGISTFFRDESEWYNSRMHLFESELIDTGVVTSE